MALAESLARRNQRERSIGLVLVAVEHIGEHLRRMVARIHVRVNPEHFAGFVDKHADPAGVSRLGIGARAIGEAKRAAGIAEHGKVERVLLGERGILFNAVETSTNNGDVVLVKEFFLVAEPAAFGGSSGSIGLREKPQKHLMTAQVLERQRFSFLGRKIKIGRSVAGLQCHRNLLSLF